MLDLSGANLIGYLLRIIRASVATNPRFNQTLGQVTFQSDNFIKYGDTQITIRDVNTSGNRMSPDYFVCNQYGRALVAKVEGKAGTFIEWINEVDPTGATPEAGVYYLNIDAVSDQTSDIDLTVEKYRWVQGTYYNAVGSIVYLRTGIDGTTLTAKDTTTGAVIPITTFSSYLYLLAPTQQLQLYDSSNTPLTPLTDYWYERLVPEVIIQSTAGGAEVANIPTPWVSFTLVDQTGYELRKGIDWNFYGTNFIQLSASTPPGSTITANVIRKVDPSSTVGTHPENILQTGVLPNETLAPGQIFIHTTENDYYTATVNSDGTVTLPTLLTPGEWLKWEVRIASGQTTCRGKKFSVNGFYDTYLDSSNQVQFITDPVTGLRTETLPGLAIAIGDSVVVGDQVAIIVSPTTTETYDVYGSKENLNFTIDVRANDLQTASDISELLKQQLLVYRRTNMEANGVTIFEAPRSFRGTQRDSSGTAPTYTYSLSVSAMADWKVFVPKVTRLVSFIITDTASLPDFQGKLQLPARVQTLGETKFQFLKWYS